MLLIKGFVPLLSYQRGTMAYCTIITIEQHDANMFIFEIFPIYKFNHI